MSMVSSGEPPGGGAEEQAEHYWGMEAGGGFWTPEAWHKSPLQMQEEARARNEADFAQAAMYGGKHSNPPQHTDAR